MLKAKTIDFVKTEIPLKILIKRGFKGRVVAQVAWCLTMGWAAEGLRFFLILLHPDWSWGPFSLLKNEYWGYLGSIEAEHIVTFS